jgi:hypothetical protein
MINQDKPSTPVEQPPPVEHTVGNDIREQASETPGPVSTPPPVSGQQPGPRQPTWQPGPPPVQTPYMRPGYYPGMPPYQGWNQFGPPPTRRSSPWPWIVLALVLVLLLAGGLSLLMAAVGFNFTGYASSSTETRHFAVSTNPTLVINNDTGNIHVLAGGTGSEMTIQATKHGASSSDVNNLQIRYNQSSADNTITVNVDRPGGFNFFNSPSVDFEVTMPSTAELQLKTNTGGIDVTGVSGQMSLTSNTGSVTARDGTLGAGSMLVSNTGSITFNGSINPSGTYQFGTNTGSVNVTLPGNASFHVDATTDTGSITSSFPGVTVQHPNFTGAEAHSDVGSSPQATVILRTNTGSINLNQG